jgi:hypothetical protein
MGWCKPCLGGGYHLLDWERLVLGWCQPRLGWLDPADLLVDRIA